MKSLKALILAALVVCAVPAFAAVDAFMKIEGIKGESTDANHSGWIAISSFSWGSPATPLAANIQSCATGEIKFTVQGNAVPLLTQKCQRNERLPEVTIEFMNTRHVLQGASIRSCQNNLFTMRFDRCVTHAAAKPVAASMVNAATTQPNGQLLLGTGAPEPMTVVGVRTQGANSAIILQRGGSSSLMQKCATGKHYDQVTLSCRKAGGTQQEYMVVKMTNVIISSYQVNGDGTVAIGLKFAKADGSFAAIQP
jgi:type VI protein secretion system component Hcp